jgi:hypothetical protein
MANHPIHGHLWLVGHSPPGDGHCPTGRHLWPIAFHLHPNAPEGIEENVPPIFMKYFFDNIFNFKLPLSCHFVS